MGFLVGLFIIIVILGALAGGKSFGGTILNGIGCLVIGMIILVVFFVLSIN